MTDFNVLNSKFISVSEISERTGFAPDDIIIELQRRGTAPIRMGNNFYLTADMLSVLFSRDNTDIFVTYQPICATDIDNRPSAELSLPQLEGREVLRVANATISFVSKEGRKKPYMVQRRVYFEDGGYKRVSKCFATREEAEAYAAKVDEDREQAVPRSESVQIAATSNSKEALGLSADYAALLGKGIDTAQTVGGNMSFYDYMLYYIEDSGQCTCGYDTNRCYITAANQIKRELVNLGCGSIKLNEIDDTVLNKVISNMVNGSASQSALDKVDIVIKMVLKYAICKGHASIIIDLIHKGKSLVKEKERPPYTDEELELIFSAAKSDLRLYAYLAISLCAGMRPSEIRALKWCDIDFDNNVIHVTKAMKREENKARTPNANGKIPKSIECVGKTKSEKGVRTLPLARDVAIVLAAWKDESGGTAESFIFTNRKGGALTDSGLHSMWSRFLKKNNIANKGFILYRFRHTFCTQLLKKYLPQKVQILMGDSSLVVIMKNYNGLKSEYILEEVREDIDAMCHIW